MSKTVASLTRGDTFKLVSGLSWFTVERIRPMQSRGNDDRPLTTKRHSGPVKVKRVVIEYKGGGRDIYCTEHRVVLKKGPESCSATKSKKTKRSK